MSMKFLFRAALVTAAMSTLAACGSDDAPGAPPSPGPTPPPPAVNTKPSYVGTVTTTAYNGTSDDLLTGGLGWDGLMGAAPVPSTPATAAELRRLAIHTNYRALVDMTANGGYGRLYGPNVSLTGTVTTTPGAGKVPGTEYIAYSLDATGKAAATLMVQIPTAFNNTNPCIVTAASSGSRGVYGAVSLAAEWGLKRGCAIAYTDKGTGNGAHELATNTITQIDGTTANATTAGNASLFTANVSTTDLATFNATFPNRYAYKHAHSQANPEKDWGTFTLQAVEFALWALNEQFAPAVTGGKGVIYRADNTVVIASSASNGGGASLMAAEQDTTGLIDGVVVGEPQINVRASSLANVAVARGGTTYPASAVGRPLYDYTSIANLLQPCAAYAASGAGAPLFSAATIPPAGATARCAALANAGIIGGADFQSQADAAMQALIDTGWQPEATLLHASHWALNATTGVAVTYANAYSRASVTANTCGFSFATTSALGVPAAPAVSPMNNIFGLGNGVPPTNGINLVYQSASGAILHNLADGNFAYDGAVCLRQLYTGANAALTTGIEEIRVAGNLRGKPAIIVHGRADALVPVNFASRAYFGANRSVEGATSQLSYIEVENGQHFDAFLGLAGYDTRFIPLHVYNIQAMNMMWAKLTAGTALPPSQVVRTTPRGGTPGAAPAVTATNVPPIPAAPAAGNLILTTTIGNVTTVQVPN